MACAFSRYMVNVGTLGKAVATTTVALLPQVVVAQGAADYPAKPVRVIVASSPGGGSDIQSRVFAQKLTEGLKQQFQVDNRPGAGDTVGTGLAAKAAPDGYTLLVATSSFTMAPALYPRFQVDPIKDFTPVSLLASSPLLLLAHPTFPVKTVKDVIALARSKPGEINMGMGPSGTSTHLMAAMFATEAKVKITLVPYQEVAKRYGDAIAGHTQMVIGPIPGVQAFVRAGRLRAIAATSAKRSSALPDVPTLSEAGVPGYDASVWYGMVAPAGVPANIVSKLNAELVRAAKAPDVVKRFAEEGGDPVGSTPEQFAQFIAAEITRWRKASKDAGVKTD